MGAKDTRKLSSKIINCSPANQIRLFAWQSSESNQNSKVTCPGRSKIG